MTKLLESAPNEFVEAAGVKFAYRRLGPQEGTPLIFLQHFTGTMDSWDPVVANGLARTRPVIVFDNSGVGKTSGKTPDNVAQMAADAGQFISALGFTKVDLLGYSLGGFIAQLLAAHSPGLVQKVILVGTAPQGGSARSTLAALLYPLGSQPGCGQGVLKPRQRSDSGSRPRERHGCQRSAGQSAD
jgi:pimeloyl-ACP methyl ester carboxylesterase